MRDPLSGDYSSTKPFESFFVVKIQKFWVRGLKVKVTTDKFSAPLLAGDHLVYFTPDDV